VDVATVWGPLAGFFAALQREPLALTPVHPQLDDQLPQTFEIAIAVRENDAVRLDRLNRFLRQRKPEIARILAAYHVPQVEAPSGATRSAPIEGEGQE
jgi:hypothetical protein